MHARPEHQSIGSRRATAALLAFLLALRAFWVPLHLALEPHGDDHGSAAVAREHHSEESPRHEHDGHAPHPAVDHLTEVAVARVASGCEVDALPPGDALGVAEHSSDGCVPTAAADVAPRPPPPRRGLARAPPVV